jgi:hypothetical protein
MLTLAPQSFNVQLVRRHHGRVNSPAVSSQSPELRGLNKILQAKQVQVTDREVTLCCVLSRPATLDAEGSEVGQSAALFSSRLSDAPELLRIYIKEARRPAESFHRALKKQPVTLNLENGVERQQG